MTNRQKRVLVNGGGLVLALGLFYLSWPLTLMGWIGTAFVAAFTAVWTADRLWLREEAEQARMRRPPDQD